MLLSSSTLLDIQNLFIMNFSIKLFSVILVLSISGVMTIHAQDLSSNDVEKQEKTNLLEDNTTTLFETYEKWLPSIVQQKDCQGETVSLYKSKANNSVVYLYIEKNGTRILYDDAGNVYCTDSESLDCRNFYELEKPEETWKCKNTSVKK